MLVLLDESLPRRLSHHLAEHEVQTVQKRGWSGLKNGDLLKRAGAEFEVFITGDQNLQYQQNTTTLPISVIVLIAVNNRIQTLLPLVPELLNTIQKISPGEVIRIERS